MLKIIKFFLFVSLSAVCLVTPLVGQEPTMQAFLNEYYSSSQKNNKKYTKLLFAMEKGYLSIAHKLLESGENPNYLTPTLDTFTPFMYAVSYGDEELVAKMIDKGADVNLKSYDGVNRTIISFKSPLQLDVAFNRNSNITKLLCNSRAKVIDKPIHSWSHDHPLTNAMQNADYQKFKILADTLSDADLIIVDSFNRNIFSTYIYWYSHPNGHENALEITNYLLNRGVPIETENGSALIGATETGNIELMNLLIGLKANINFNVGDQKLYSYSKPPLISALQYCQSRDGLVVRDNLNGNNNYFVEKHEPLKLLLENNVEINFALPILKNAKPEDSGFSPLGYAIRYNLNNAAALLISFGADVDMCEGSGRTPLIRAVESNNLDGVVLLLNAGADPTKPGTNSKTTPIDIAFSLGDSEIFRALIEAEANMY